MTQTKTLFDRAAAPPVGNSGRSRRWSWAPNGWHRIANLTATHCGTQFIALGIPDDFWAVRAGLANIMAQPWKVSLIKACASANWSDYVNPIGVDGGYRPAQDWSTLTASGGGIDDPRIVQSASGPRQLIAIPNAVDSASGETENTAWTWSDWVPCASVGGDPLTGLRVLMIRAFVPAGQNVVFCNGMFEGYFGNEELHHGFDYFMGGLGVGIDMVTDPEASHQLNFATTDLRRSGFLNGSVIACVQALTTHHRVVGMSTGDSHHSGAGTTTSFFNYLLQHTVRRGRSNTGKVPMGLVNSAVGGMTSSRFFARLDTLLESVGPDYVVLPGWTYNDHSEGTGKPDQDNHVFFARLISMSEKVRARGALPIWLTPFPRDRSSMTTPILKSWRDLRRRLLSLEEHGEVLIDAAKILGAITDGELDGTYIEGTTDDGVHPNNAGHLLLADALDQIVSIRYNLI